MERPIICIDCGELEDYCECDCYKKPKWKKMTFTS